MNYYVFGSDDHMYGPVDAATIQLWAREGRVTTDTRLRSAETGEETTWGAVDPAGPPPPVARYSAPAENPYPRQGFADAPVAPVSDAGKSEVIWSFVDSGLALLSFFGFGGMGVIFGGFGVYNAIRGRQYGHPLGNLAIGVSSVCLLIVLVGWFFRSGR